MIRIIKNNPIRCCICKSYLEYSNEDIKRSRYKKLPTDDKPFYFEKKYINCPVCDGEIIFDIQKVDVELEVESNWC